MIAVGRAHRPRIDKLIGPEVVGHVGHDCDDETLELQLGELVRHILREGRPALRLSGVEHLAPHPVLRPAHPHLDGREPRPEVVSDARRQPVEGVGSREHERDSVSPKTVPIGPRRPWDQALRPGLAETLVVQMWCRRLIHRQTYTRTCPLTCTSMVGDEGFDPPTSAV